MTETIEGLIKWMRENRKVRIIKAVTDIDNISSVKVFEKNGFRTCERIDNSVILKLELFN
jgi:RimJ/RimL family protein N-acetyltransferase